MSGKSGSPGVVLGVTGGIACYKACELVRLLQKAGCDVWVVMTENATRFVSPLTFETLTGHPVATDTFVHAGSWEVEHIALAKRAQVFVVAPATANILAKMACGIADDMLSTTLLATRAPVVVAPAMNTQMYDASATQDNLRTLRSRGVHIVEPAVGHLACGDSGRGKLADVAEISTCVLSLLSPVRDMEGLRVVVTAGPTREPLDPVRYLTNRSSGKMGYALARDAAQRGADVLLLSGPVSLTPPDNVRLARFETTRQMQELVLGAAPGCDILIQAAAPADYRPAQVAPQKIKKQQGEDMVLHLVENPDVARAAGETKRPGQVFVGFAAETEQVEENAVSKLERKHLDLIVANDVTQPGAGFDVETNIVTLITRGGLRSLPLMSKAEVAREILNEVLRLRQAH